MLCKVKLDNPVKGYTRLVYWITKHLKHSKGFREYWKGQCLYCEWLVEFKVPGFTSVTWEKWRNILIHVIMTDRKIKTKSSQEMPKRPLIHSVPLLIRKLRIFGTDGHFLNLMKDIDQKPTAILYTNLKH